MADCSWKQGGGLGPKLTLVRLRWLLVIPVIFLFQLSNVAFDCPVNFSQCQLSYLEFQLSVEFPGCVYGPACQKLWQSQCTPLQGILSEIPGFCKFHLCTLRVARGWNASEQNRTGIGELSEEMFQQWFSRSFSPKLWICYRRVILAYISLPVIDPYLRKLELFPTFSRRWESIIYYRKF